MRNKDASFSYQRVLQIWQRKDDTTSHRRRQHVHSSSWTRKMCAGSGIDDADADMAIFQISLFLLIPFYFSQTNEPLSLSISSLSKSLACSPSLPFSLRFATRRGQNRFLCVSHTADDRDYFYENEEMKHLWCWKPFYRVQNHNTQGKLNFEFYLNLWHLNGIFGFQNFWKHTIVYFFDFLSQLTTFTRHPLSTGCT